jgi:hypothetical protein
MSITLTRYDFDHLDNVQTFDGKAVIFGSMTKSNIKVPEGASELEITISICCNGPGEGLAGPDGSAAYIRVDDDKKEEKIDSLMDYHHGNYYKYEFCETIPHTFDCSGKERITLKIEMSGGARLDFKQAKLTFSWDKSKIEQHAVIGDIVSDLEFYEGQKVIIDGEYRGWNCSGLGGPPVTRSDWCVRDGTGIIYVTGKSPGLDYPDDMGERVIVTGVVRVTESDIVYIEATSIEI